MKRTTKTTTRIKVNIEPYVSGSADKNRFDVNYGVNLSKGPVNFNIDQSAGTGYKPETTFTLGVNIPITKRIKNRGSH
jgi:hypothetical protein